ncbi:hypothetical protein CC86DRAFT_292773 [Ophiobolus disseminans]|uniref:Uncharacterized protein n=1 Tax=Ophiobolus disseminans TaxID=1469910 RepID=A0A6A6ZZS7_9PLEO|nr:hypothetical protein CC86DRAFT_292773 [Ophiobolus disseminans]
MSPYQHIFSANAVLGVWRNLRTSRDHSDVLLTLQYQPDDARSRHARQQAKGQAVRTTTDVSDRQTVDGGGRSMSFVVPWRSMQAQRRELKQRERELAEALVIRHLAAGLSRQMSKTELQMADNAPFSTGKNLHTGGEVAQRFLPTIQTLFHQQPVPQRMIFELLMELKDLIHMGMAGCEREVLEWELDGSAVGALEELDTAFVKAVAPPVASSTATEPGLLLRRKASSVSIAPPSTAQSFLAADPSELLCALESLETTARALAHLTVPMPDFCAHAVITLRRLAPRQALTDFLLAKKRRTARCADYARCMKWAGTDWRHAGGCRRGCKNEDEDPENLPSWHRSSRWYDDKGSGTFMVGGGRAGRRDEGVVTVDL